MQANPPGRAGSEGDEREAATAPLLHRALALVALLALLAAGAITAWWVLTDQLDLRRALGNREVAIEETDAIDGHPPPGRPE